jgi:polyvinyl alcohol dehydrogenase (cytochrome)
LDSGAVRWQTVLTGQQDADVFGSPTFHGGVGYIGTSGPNGDGSHARGTVVAVDERDGGVRWRTYTVPTGHDGAPVWSTPALDTATGRLYVGTGNAYHPPVADTTDAVLALDAATGAILGHFQATKGDAFSGEDNPAGPDYDFGASPNLLAGGLVGEGSKSGDYWALDRETLKPAWKVNVGPALPIGGILGSTAYDGARVYGTDAANGGVWALGRGGSAAWNSADPSSGDFSPVAVAHGVLYTVHPGGSLVARDATTGAVLSQTSLGGASFGGVSADGAAVFAAVGTGPLPPPGPQQDPTGSIVAFGDTSRSGPPRVELGLRLTSRAPASPSGVSVSLRFNPSGDRDGKPSPLRVATIHAPSGLRFDNGALARCTASDDELKTRGSDACPAASKLTVGSFSAMSGTPADPLGGDDHVFNGNGEIIEVITVPGASPSPGFDRLKIAGSTLTAHPPTTPGGPPDGETAVKSIAFDVPVRTSGGRSLITTPPVCPASGVWTTTGTFGFADGTVETASATTPCERPLLRLVVAPRHVRAGRAVRVRARVAGTCRAAAHVWIAGRRARPNRSGRAILRLTLHRKRVYTVRATAPGCVPAIARIRAR